MTTLNNEITCTVSIKEGQVLPRFGLFKDSEAVIEKVDAKKGWVWVKQDGNVSRINKRWILQSLFEYELKMVFDARRY